MSLPPLNRRSRIRNWVILEKSSGLLLIGAAVVALIVANSPWREGYAALTQLRVGPEVLNLNLTLSHWAADGLLAVFFFVVGVELKHEVVAGSLRRPRDAAVPVLAALGGMIVPAAIYLSIVVALDDRTALDGWAIPTATDIAFALGVLAVFGKGLPRALRVFLLTLAVVDDLLAIIVIAVAYTSGVDLLALGLSLATILVFGFLVRTRRMRWWLLVPLALVAWGFMHESGVHATVAGVLLGFCVPAKPRAGEAEPRTHQLGDAIRPWSAGIALPVFAFFSAGVSLVDGGGPAVVLGQPVVLAIVLGLVVGKLVGVLGVTALVTKVTPLRLPNDIGLRDLFPIGLLTGIGFTVSLLIAELSFPDAEHTDGAKVAILTGSLLAALLAAFALRWNARRARSLDENEDGILDTPTGAIGGPGDDERPGSS